jgi:hypothetical protein
MKTHPDLRPAPKLIGTIGGIPIYADEACPKGRAYIIRYRDAGELRKLQDIFGSDLKVLKWDELQSSD